MNGAAIKELMEFVDIVENENNNANLRILKIYVRDAANLLEYYHDKEFKGRYRFMKETVVDVMLLVIEPNLRKLNS